MTFRRECYFVVYLSVLLRKLYVKRSFYIVSCERVFEQISQLHNKNRGTCDYDADPVKNKNKYFHTINNCHLIFFENVAIVAYTQPLKYGGCAR